MVYISCETCARSWPHWKCCECESFSEWKKKGVKKDNGSQIKESKKTDNRNIEKGNGR